MVLAATNIRSTTLVKAILEVTKEAKQEQLGAWSAAAEAGHLRQCYTFIRFSWSVVLFTGSTSYALLHTSVLNVILRVTRTVKVVECKEGKLSKTGVS